MVIVLEAAGGRLRLETEVKDWCHMFLETGSTTLELGADTKSIIVERLLAGLSNNPPGDRAGTIQGQEVRAVMSLFEGHATVYTTEPAAGPRTLYFQAEDGGLLFKLPLSDDERLRWIHILTESGKPRTGQ